MTKRRVESLPTFVPAAAPALSTAELIAEVYRLRNLGKQLEAEPLIASVLEDANHPARLDHNFWRALAIWSADAHHHESVRDAYREIIKMGPDMPQPWDEYALALSACGDWSDAIDAVKLGLDLVKIRKLPPHHPTAISLHITRGALYLRQGQPMRAREFFRAALAERGAAPPESQYALSQVKLLLDHDAEAWRMHEARLTHVAVYQWEAWHAPKVRRWWPGLKGRVVFWQEQGAGDLIQMLRFLPVIAQSSGEEVVVRCDPHLWSIVREFDGVAAVVGRQDAVDADFELPILSAPFAFGCDGWSDVPAPTCPDALRWSRPPEADRLTIGLCWSGAKGHPNDRDRSMPLPMLDKLREQIAGANVQYQALQPGEVPYWMAPLPSGDYGTTAKTLKTCHAVLTVDTSVVHLAATMGVPTVCILPSASEWRWGMGHTSPWYPHLQIIRRPSVTNWGRAIDIAGDWLRHTIGRKRKVETLFHQRRPTVKGWKEIPYGG